MIKLPARTLDKLNELQDLIDQHPINIPAYALARFMEIDADGLRRRKAARPSDSAGKS